MAYTIRQVPIIEQKIGETSTTAKLPLGTHVEAVDSSGIAGTFIYLKAGATHTNGKEITWDKDFKTTETIGTAGNPLGYSASAIAQNAFGWFQVAGTVLNASDAVVHFNHGPTS